jgi:hypothetical protein
MSICDFEVVIYSVSLSMLLIYFFALRCERNIRFLAAISFTSRLYFASYEDRTHLQLVPRSRNVDLYIHPHMSSWRSA